MMTETTLLVRLAELTTVRVACRKGSCGGVIEIPIAKLVGIMDAVQCPVCHKQFVRDTTSNPLRDLGTILDRLSLLGESFELEFPVSVDAKARPATHC